MLPLFRNIAAHTERRVQRTLTLGPYFLRTKLFVAHGGYKYLGIKPGYTTPQEAYAPAIQKAMGWALSMHHWRLTLRERVFVLKMWILPVLVLRAPVTYRVKQVVDSLKLISKTAVGLSSWGTTHDMLDRKKAWGLHSLEIF